jgi:hypothetical protein
VFGLVIITAFQRFEIDPAFLGRRNVLDAIAAEGRGRGVRPVRALRHKHHLPRIAAGLERRADAQQAAQLTVRPRLGAHGQAVHAGEVEQPEGELIDHLERALHRFPRLEGMDVGEAGQPRHFLVETRIVLHGARAEGE